MDNLPFDIRRYLYKQCTEKTLFAYISIDKLDFSIEWSDNLSRLYGIELNQHQPIDEQLPFLHGIYPYEENYPLILDEVNFPTQRAADLHIVPSRYKLCILLFDVTKALQLHRELQQKRNELRLLYEQEMRSMRSLQQSYHDLKRQKEFAENANLAKSDFLRHISRDLKSPLNGILGFTQLLEMLDNSLPAEAQEYVQQIKSSSASLLALINELLDIDKLDSLSIKINPELVNVSNLIKESVSHLRPIAKQNNIAFINRLNQNLPLILIDSMYFRQILVSILSNAIKYNRDNGCIIINSYITSNNCLRINIKDTGIGIEPHYLSAVFQTLAQHETVENTEIAEKPIDLSSCKQLTDLMRGTIGVYSDVGIGSLFWLEFPLDNEPLTKTPRLHKPQNILYIEDNPTYLFLMNCFLEQRHDSTLLNAKNKEEIFELASKHAVSVILLDTETFESNYLEVFQILQACENTQNIPVIALFNANTELSEIKTALNTGFYDYMVKPFDFNQVMELFDRLVAIQ